MSDPVETERVRRLAADALRSWLVANGPSGGPVVPLRWLREEIHAMIECYPGDRRRTEARGVIEGFRRVLRLLDEAERRQPP